MLDMTAFQFGSPDPVSVAEKESFARLFDYHYRANRRLWRAVMALSDEQFSQARDGHPSIQTQIVRMVANENL